MPAPIFLRSGLIGSAVAAIVASTFGFASHSLGSALVGETRQISVERKPAAGIGAILRQSPSWDSKAATRFRAS
jgi:hypothetical protein